MTKIMLMYPPGDCYQRGEDRCQININASTVNSIRACNDLGYISSCLKRSNYEIFLRDYQGEEADINALLSDIDREKPDVIFISITNGSIYRDLEIISQVKEKYPNIIFILKGAIFFNPNKTIFEELDLSNIEYLIGGEVEFIIENLVNAHYRDKSLLKNIQGISFKTNNGEWISNFQTEFNDNLDSLPFPDRALMNNKLYINPSTNKAMALITIAKGCPFSCIYCLSNKIEGRKIRSRSAKNIFNEIKECVEKFQITNFFFKSDTFTANKELVIELCSLLIDSKLNNEIEWVTTARVDTLDDELVKLMKEAGCKLLAIGFESGSNESLKLMKKNTTTEQNVVVSKLCKKYGIQILGYFLIGFPWETKEHLNLDKKHIFDIDADYIEISVVVPFAGTTLFDEYYKTSKTESDILGYDSYNNLFKNDTGLSSEDLENFRKSTLLKYYTRPKYIINKLKKITSVSVLNNYIKYGIKMLKNSL